MCENNVNCSEHHIIDKKFIDLSNHISKVDKLINVRLGDLEEKLNNINKKVNQEITSEEEKQLVSDILKQSVKRLKNIKLVSITISLVIVVVVAYYIYNNWSKNFLSPNLSLTIGGQLLCLGGTLLFVINAFTKINSYALSSITYRRSNINLFIELCKSKYFSFAGIWFMLVGFLIQAAMLILSGIQT